MGEEEEKEEEKGVEKEMKRSRRRRKIGGGKGGRKRGGRTKRRRKRRRRRRKSRRRKRRKKVEATAKEKKAGSLRNKEGKEEERSGGAKVRPERQTDATSYHETNVLFLYKLTLTFSCVELFWLTLALMTKNHATSAFAKPSAGTSCLGCSFTVSLPELYHSHSNAISCPCSSSVCHK